MLVEAIERQPNDEFDSAGAKYALQALAHFAADDSYRRQLAGWGALPALCAALSAGRSPDTRVRAVALSAVANVSFVDAGLLLAVGAAPAG